VVDSEGCLTYGNLLINDVKILKRNRGCGLNKSTSKGLGSKMTGKLRKRCAASSKRVRLMSKNMLLIKMLRKKTWNARDC